LHSTGKRPKKENKHDVIQQDKQNDSGGGVMLIAGRNTMLKEGGGLVPRNISKMGLLRCGTESKTLVGESMTIIY